MLPATQVVFRPDVQVCSEGLQGWGCTCFWKSGYFCGCPGRGASALTRLAGVSSLNPCRSQQGLTGPHLGLGVLNAPRLLHCLLYLWAPCGLSFPSWPHGSGDMGDFEEPKAVWVPRPAGGLGWALHSQLNLPSGGLAKTGRRSQLQALHPAAPVWEPVQGAFVGLLLRGRGLALWGA